MFYSGKHCSLYLCGCALTYKHAKHTKWNLLWQQHYQMTSSNWQIQFDCDQFWGLVEILGSRLHSWGQLCCFYDVAICTVLQGEPRSSGVMVPWGVSLIYKGLGADSVYHLTSTKIQAREFTSRILYHKTTQAFLCFRWNQRDTLRDTNIKCDGSVHVIGREINLRSRKLCKKQTAQLNRYYDKVSACLWITLTEV